MVAGLGVEQVDRRLKGAVRAGDRSQRVAAFYLAEVEERGLYQAFGCPSVVAYAVRELGMRRRTVRELLTAGRRLGELVGLDRAFERGEVSWSRVRKLCRVATKETEGAWLDYAQRVTQDRLDGVVRRAQVGDLPPSEDDGGLPVARFRVSAELTPAQWQV